jgi:hypothetical protein
MGSRCPVNGPLGLDQFLTGAEDHPVFWCHRGREAHRREDVSKFRLGPIFA